MAFHFLSSLPSLLGTSACTSWLQRVAGPATACAAGGARRGLAAARAEDEPPVLQAAGTPPPWEPPPHNPRSLKPKPAPTLPEILARIQQAPSVVEVHNAYRRKSGCLPPPIAAAMLTRVAQLLAASPPRNTPKASATTIRRGQRGQGPLLAEIRKSWDVFLQLTSAQHLAALVRASGETGLLRPDRHGASLGAVKSGVATASPVAAVGGADCDLVQRSLEVLLDADGKELAAAGPQAVLDVSYGLMLADHDEPDTWRTLGPMLRTAQAQLQEEAAAAAGGSSGNTAQGKDLAGKVLGWLNKKGIPV
ncbi:hypothetical protein VaNZ11_012697 [Volvox africanus]|uniref:Uncharacterized protein n=1 Tax=Volvox africanus TaxID=51714 RepID=A0ABQ5SEM6_9CHLO|nr:hypothetical protein VaNZ11_012697 [Volvox africanus]